MNKTSIFLTALALLVSLAGVETLKAEPRTLDSVVAVVDDDVILKSELDARLADIQQQIRERNLPAPPADMLRKEVLEQLILEHLQLQMAERTGVRIDDNQMLQTMSAIAEQNGMTFEQFREILDSNGLYLITRNQIAREMTINQLQQRAVNSRIDITRQEIENFLRSEAGISSSNPEYHVAHLLVEVADDNTRAQRQELADYLYEQISEGVDIIRIGGIGNIGGIPISGGDLGWRKPENLPTVFRDVVPGMSVGEIAEFTSNSGIHIVQLLETRGGANLTLDQTRMRHIMITTNEIRTEAQAEQLAWDIYQRIQDGEDFGDLARKNSNDSSSMVAGGDLGWVNPGQYPPDFMAVVDRAELDVVQEPFRAQTGWHIVEVHERRKQDVTEENKRYQATQILRQRKFEMELENWLTEIRDRAYVDIKLD